MTKINGDERFGQPTVGFCGLGAMGFGMATHLLKSGFRVFGFDTWEDAVTRFVKVGGESAGSPAELAKQCQIVYVMVTSATQVDSVLFDSTAGVVRNLAQGSAVVVSSTVPPSYWRGAETRFAGSLTGGASYLLDCPVSGGTPRAANGTLSIFASGLAEGLAIAHPVLTSLSEVLYHIPGPLGSGSKAKMCHQVMPEAEIALLAEVMAVAAKAGLNTRATLDFVQKHDGASWINGNRIPHLLEADPRIYSVIPNSAKDSSIITTTAREVRFPVPLVAVAEQVYQECIHLGWESVDDAHIARLYLRGLPDDYVHRQTKVPENAVGPRGQALSINFDTINDLFAGAHLAISAEAMGFTEAVGLDTTTMYDIISKAAGSNVQFVNGVPHMQKPTWSLNDVPESRKLLERLVCVVPPQDVLTEFQQTALSKTGALGISMPICSIAAQRYCQALGCDTVAA